MGFGDPYHKHSLREVFYHVPKNDDRVAANCFHCELPIPDFLSDGECYGCTDCDYYIHKLCQDLPITLLHPFHDKHHLTRFEPPSASHSPNLCNECQNPCLGRFAYHCPTCQLFFHLKCLFTLKHEKHDHPLILSDDINEIEQFDCNICGYPVLGFNFGCKSCNFYMHTGCSLIPGRIEHYHRHELTLRHNFPEECDQVVCDLCEDKDGLLDRTLSYYYCKRCDYIAHVHCCITEPREGSVLYESFIHKHHVGRVSGDIWCNQCDYVAKFWHSEYPSLIKHPSHPEHTIAINQDGDDAFNCTECKFSMEKKKGVRFTHPLWRNDLKFYCKNNMFRCDACGELGKGSSVGNNDNEAMTTRFGDFDLHLECFALPGKLEHESHPNHPLYLRWLRNVSNSRYCRVCTKEMDPQLWFYFCQECDYAAHINCVACDLLSTFRSSIKNQPEFCAIIEPDKTLFEYQIADRGPLKSNESYYFRPPVLDYYDEEKCDSEIETVDDIFCCPKCNLVLCTQARPSTIDEWESIQFKNSNKNSITYVNNQATHSILEPLSFLDEQVIDELCCSICNVLIFPPTHSCFSCQIYFHKSCAELPQKIVYNKTTYVLMAPPFPEGFSDCNYCNCSISGYAYLSLPGGLIFDVQCAARAPLLKPTYHNTGNMTYSRTQSEIASCRACKNNVEMFTFMMGDELHLECALLPPVIKHKIHQHPLELATDLAMLYDEYICDVCEMDLNPNLWAYRCVDSCGIKATSHVTCVITSKKKCHFRYDQECQNMTEKEKVRFQKIRQGEDLKYSDFSEAEESDVSND